MDWNFAKTARVLFIFCMVFMMVLTPMTGYLVPGLSAVGVAEATSERWTYATAENYHASTSFNGYVYVKDHSTNHNLKKVDVSDGTEVWSKQVNGGGSMANDGQYLYKTEFNSGNPAVNSYYENGTKRWSSSITGQGETVAVNPGLGVVYVGLFSGDVAAIDSSDGSTLWTAKVGSDFVNSLAVGESNDTLYAGNTFQLIKVDSSGTILQNKSTDRLPQDVNPSTGVLYAVDDSSFDLISLDVNNVASSVNSRAGTYTDWHGMVHYDKEADRVYAISDDGADILDGSLNLLRSGKSTSVKGKEASISQALTNVTVLYSDSATTNTVHAIDTDVKSDKTSTVSGNVVDESGNPIDNATVELWGVNYDHPDVQDSTDAINQIRSVSDRIPTDWNENLQLTASNGFFKNASTNYAAVTTSTVGGDPWVDSADLGSPQLKVPAGEPLVLTEWTPNGGLASTLDEYDNQLPGKTVDDGTIVVEELDGKDDLINKETYDLDKQAGGGLLDPSSLSYAEVQLQPGYYRVYPEGSPATGYVIQVGSTTEILDTLDANLTTPSGVPSEAASAAKNKLSDSLFTKTTVTTNATGHFSADVPKNVKTVGIQAYKAGGKLNTSSKPTLADVRSLAQTRYNGSIVVSTSPKIVDTPASGVTVRAYEFETPPFYNLSDYANRTAWLQDLLSNMSYADLPPVLQQRLNNTSQEDIDKLHSELQNLTEQNSELNQRYQEIVEEDDSKTEEIRKLQQALTELRNTIESGNPTQSTTSNTVSLTFPFDSNLNPRQVAVLVHYSNGTTKTLSDDSQYVSIDNRVGGDAVEITDYPMGEGDAAVANFEVKVATENGIGKNEKQVRNPTYQGDLPSLDAISLSTLRPGPSETVSMTLHPSSDTKFKQVTGLTVYGPSGAEVPASVTGGRNAEFETNGGGTYHVQATFQGLDGNNFTETFQVRAGDTDLDMPASVRAVDSPLGNYALTGDGLESGAVTVKEGGSTTTITAQLAEDADVPRTLHVHTTGLSLPPDNSLKINVVRGADQKSVSRHVRVAVHMQSIPEKSTLYREGDQPLPRDGQTEYGSVNTSSSATVIKTYTDDDGRVMLTTNANPSIIERALYFVRTRAPSVDVPLSIGPVAPGLSLGGAAAILAFRRRRHA